MPAQLRDAPTRELRPFRAGVVQNLNTALQTGMEAALGTTIDTRVRPSEAITPVAAPNLLGLDTAISTDPSIDVIAAQAISLDEAIGEGVGEALAAAPDYSPAPQPPSTPYTEGGTATAGYEDLPALPPETPGERAFFYEGQTPAQRAALRRTNPDEVAFSPVGDVLPASNPQLQRATVGSEESLLAGTSLARDLEQAALTDLRGQTPRASPLARLAATLPFSPTRIAPAPSAPGAAAAERRAQASSSRARVTPSNWISEAEARRAVRQAAGRGSTARRLPQRATTRR